MLYYIVTHNVTVSGSVEVEHTTNLSILLSGTKPGLIYLVTVHAVNAVGDGMNTSDTCTLTTTGQTCLQTIVTIHNVYYKLN